MKLRRLMQIARRAKAYQGRRCAPVDDRYGVIRNRDGRSHTTVLIRFAPKADIRELTAICPLRANCDHKARQRCYEDRTSHTVQNDQISICAL